MSIWVKGRAEKRSRQQKQTWPQHACICSFTHLTSKYLLSTFLCAGWFLRTISDGDFWYTTNKTNPISYVNEKSRQAITINELNARTREYRVWGAHRRGISQGTNSESPPHSGLPLCLSDTMQWVVLMTESSHSGIHLNTEYIGQGKEICYLLFIYFCFSMGAFKGSNSYYMDNLLIQNMMLDEFGHLDCTAHTQVYILAWHLCTLPLP